MFIKVEIEQCKYTEKAQEQTEPVAVQNIVENF